VPDEWFFYPMFQLVFTNTDILFYGHDSGNEKQKMNKNLKVKIGSPLATYISWLSYNYINTINV
jgi:hypothetical protein